MGVHKQEQGWRWGVGGVDAHWAGWSPGGGGAGQGGACVDTHLPQGAGQTAELVGRVDGHHTHGGRGDGPAQGIGPLGEGVGSVVRGPEGHDAHHDHKLKVRAELRLQLSAGRPGGPGARVSRGGSPRQGGTPQRVGALTCRSARAGVGWGGGGAPPRPWWPCLAHALRVTCHRVQETPPRTTPRPPQLSERHRDGLEAGAGRGRRRLRGVWVQLGEKPCPCWRPASRFLPSPCLSGSGSGLVSISLSPSLSVSISHWLAQDGASEPPAAADTQPGTVGPRGGPRGQDARPGEQLRPRQPSNGLPGSPVQVLWATGPRSATAPLCC